MSLNDKKLTYELFFISIIVATISIMYLTVSSYLYGHTDLNSQTSFKEINLIFFQSGPMKETRYHIIKLISNFYNMYLLYYIQCT